MVYALIFMAGMILGMLFQHFYEAYFIKEQGGFYCNTSDDEFNPVPQARTMRQVVDDMKKEGR
jgi:hypothetical protein